MSTRTANEPKAQGLSITTLLIASVSSIAAALFIHKFWTGGAILGAGITPVIVAVVSESLKRPTRKITAIREERRSRTSVARDSRPDAPVAPPPELERADPFGIWQEDTRSSWWDRLKGRPLKIALATGALAFLVGAFALTGAELVFGGGGGGGDRLTIVPGKQDKRDADDKKTTTEPTQTTETAPDDTEQPPAETGPQTTPTVPPEEQVPTTPTPTTPAPTTPAPAPAPGGTPAPEQPATPPAG